MTGRTPALVLTALLLVAAGLWLALRGLPEPAPKIAYRLLSFERLNGWAGDHHGPALAAFIRSCARFAGRGDLEAVDSPAIAGRIGDWRQPCRDAIAVPAGDDHAARLFFESHFRPVAIDGPRGGLVTGYYEPEIAGSRVKKPGFEVPLYRRPNDLVTVDLGLFRASLAGRRIAGRAIDGKLKPFEDRARIDAGALTGRGLELVWLADPVAAFFVHIQGSARVILDDGGTMRVAFDGHNGHPYTAIGRVLVAAGALRRDGVSMQSIRQWLAAHPDRAAQVMAANGSYIFFREIDGEGPIGAQGVVLTAGRSLAVDRRYIALGLPVWVTTEAAPDHRQPAIRRLMVAQDSGGAIRGPQRGDIYFGGGAKAGAVAGRMQARGRIRLLLPVAVAARLGGR